MGVVTTADEKIESAREHLDGIVNDLRHFIDPSTWGHDDFEKEYINNAEEAYLLIIKAKRLLNP